MLGPIGRDDILDIGAERQARLARLAFDPHFDGQERRVVDPDPDLFDAASPAHTGRPSLRRIEEKSCTSGARPIGEPQ